MAKLADVLLAQALRTWLIEAEPGALVGLGSIHDRPIANALEALSSRPAEPWSLDRLAKHVGLSRTALAVRFRDRVGVPPMRYLTKLRLSQAAGYLATGHLSIQEIAGLAGYENDATLSRAFKLSPLDVIDQGHAGTVRTRWRMSSTRSPILPDERRRLIAERLRQHGSVSVSGLEAEFRVSPMTARRDLDELERRGIARRTHGGAVLPGLSSHEDSFLQRLEVAIEAKERLAEEALRLIEPGEAVFVDSSTTGYITARRIVRENLKCTLLTNSVPLMQLVCELDAPQVEVIGAGGTLRKLTRSFVGPQAIRTIEAHFADHVLFSVRGLTDDGFLTDPDPLESEVKRAMIKRARHAVVLVDGSKFDRPALTQIAHVDEIGMILAADVDESSLTPLVRAGIEVRRV